MTILEVVGYMACLFLVVFIASTIVWYACLGVAWIVDNIDFKFEIPEPFDGILFASIITTLVVTLIFGLTLLIKGCS